MGNKQIKVLHIDTERSWRGGQQQAAYLFESMYYQGFTTKLICQPGSVFKQYCIDRKLPYAAISMRAELDIIAAIKIVAITRREGYKILHLHSAHALSIENFWTECLAFCANNFIFKGSLTSCRIAFANDFGLRGGITNPLC